MNISEKILKFAENQKTIDAKLHGDFSEQYQNGYNVGYTEGKTDGYNDGYDVGMVDGVASVPNPLEYATRIYYLFQNAVFPDNYTLELNGPRATDVCGLLNDASGITKLTLKGNNNGSAINFAQFARGCASIVEIDLTNFIVKPNSINLMCSNAKALKTIKGEIDLTECTNTVNAFVYCYALEEIRFKANSIKLSISFSNSTLLTDESIQSIIDGLATVETTQKLTLYSTVSSALTDDQMSQILAKNWSVE